MHTGWVFTRTGRNNANTHILAALKAVIDEVPFEAIGLDFDKRLAFLNQAVINWAATRGIFFTRSRPYKKRTTKPRSSPRYGHLVRKHGSTTATTLLRSVLC